MDKAFKSDQDAHEVMIYAETERWPSGVEEETEIKKAFIQKSPELLITVPENQELFDRTELYKLLPIAKRALKGLDD